MRTLVKAAWRIQNEVLEGPQPGPPARNPLPFAFVATTYLMFAIAVLVLDVMYSAGTDVALYRVTHRENFEHPLNDGNGYVFIVSLVAHTL